MADLFANIGNPHQILHSAASDLGLHYLPVTLLGFTRLKWVKRKQSITYKWSWSRSSWNVETRTMARVDYNLPNHSIFSKYSRLLLSRLGLSRITAYFIEKILYLFKHENLITGNKILWKRGEIRSNFCSFFTIFTIYISLTSQVK